jgi:hypothetical protein
MRAFLICNGRSLIDHCLLGHFDLLADETTFGMNKISLLYEPDPDVGIPGTDWRPSHYLFFEHRDPGRSEDERIEVGLLDYVRNQIMLGGPCYIRKNEGEGDLSWLESIRGHLGGVDFPNVIWVDSPTCGHDEIGAALPPEPSGWHLPVLCRYGGTAHIGAQMAFMMGYDPVVVIGADLYDDDEPDHFHPAYYEFDDYPLSSRNEVLSKMWALVRREYERQGRTIVNAGLGDRLEVLERVSFQEVIHAG